MRPSVIFVSFAAVVLSVFGCGSNPSAEAANKAVQPTAAASTTKAAPAKTTAPAMAAPAKAAPTAPATAAPAKAATAAPAANAEKKPVTVVKTWDFTKIPVDKWQWTFPGSAKNQQKFGAVYSQKADEEAWIQLRHAEVKAESADAIQISCYWRDQEDEAKKADAVEPKEAAVFWTRSTEVPAAGKWPFSNDRVVILRPDPSNPSVFTAQMKGQKNWDGVVDCLGIRLVFDAPKSKPNALGHVAVQSISLTK